MTAFDIECTVSLTVVAHGEDEDAVERTTIEMLRTQINSILRGRRYKDALRNVVVEDVIYNDIVEWEVVAEYDDEEAE